MGFACGLVGLPRVGKSTIFNLMTVALDERPAPTSPLDPNRALVPVPDPRLSALTAMYNPESEVATRLEVVDIAGVMKGASEGEGLGNQFLGHIKDVEALVHVVRCFDNLNVAHVHDDIDPVRDVEEVELELIACDAETVQNKIKRIEKKARLDKEIAAELESCIKVKAGLDEAIPARQQDLTETDIAAVQECCLLTIKSVMYVANLGDDSPEDGPPVQALIKHAEAEGTVVVAVRGRAEADVAELDEKDQPEFMEALGITELSFDRLIRAGYDLLGLITMFTSGEDECRAWTIHGGLKAPQASGKIHTDMEKGFIRLEVMPIDLLLELGSEQAVKAAGKFRLEGKDYVVQDGDVVVVRFNN